MLVARMRELATQYGRYGYRRITALLQCQRWRLNHKSIQRLGRRQRLNVRHNPPQRSRLWLNDGSCIPSMPCSSTTGPPRHIQLLDPPSRPSSPCRLWVPLR